jgi:putative glutamine amidotransferase
MFMAGRPRIGITMRLEQETRRFYLGRDYSEAVESAGGVPVHLSLIPKADYVAAAIEELDGLLLPGSNTDVDPQFYGEEPHHKLGTVIPEKDETDRLALAETERRKMPVLAICYGMQALNVFRGGTLVQDIPSQLNAPLRHNEIDAGHLPDHKLEIESDTILGRLPSVQAARLNGGVIVNSSHHQSIATVGSDLVATAWTEDGVIECIEDTREDRFALGVQWHPELTAGRDAVSREIFELFVAKCRKP